MIPFGWDPIRWVENDADLGVKPKVLRQDDIIYTYDPKDKISPPLRKI